MKPQIYVDATALPFAPLVEWARRQGYTCHNDNGRVYFQQRRTAPGVSREEFEEVYGRD